MRGQGLGVKDGVGSLSNYMPAGQTSNLQTASSAPEIET
jgi:hypothetical protein